MDDVDFADAAISGLTTQLAVPVEKAGVDVTLIKEEWKDMVGYGKHYLNLVHCDCATIWWQLFNAADSSKWTNVLVLIALLFYYFYQIFL